MTINYPDGTVLRALLLSRGNDTLRAAIPVAGDIRTFTRITGAWISEKDEPVEIEFAWQHEQDDVLSETECVCSKDLASCIVSVLRACPQEDALLDLLYVFSPEGHRVRIQQSRLDIWRAPAEVKLTQFGESRSMAHQSGPELTSQMHTTVRD